MPGLLDRLLDTGRPYALLILIGLLLWLPGFFSLPPSDRDEARFAQASRQMLDSGDYVSIRNGAEARNQKPIGIYWLQLPFAAAARAAGLAQTNPIWPYRMPSLIGGLLATCATFWLGRGLVGARAALLGALMLTASLVLTIETHIAKTDAALLAATTFAMGVLALAYVSPGRIARRHWVGFWLAMGAGILIKGPITPVVAGLTVLTLVLFDRGRASWLRHLRPGIGPWLTVAVAVPWFIAIGLRTHGAFFEQAVGGDLANKLAGGDDAHGAPPGLHLLLLSMSLFPSAFVVLAALPSAWRARRAPATRFLLAWAIPSWLVFEAVPTKLPHYTLPLIPALCLIGAAWALDPNRVSPVWLRRGSLGMSVLAAALLGLGAAALPAVVGTGWSPRVLLGVPTLLAAGLIGWLLVRRGLGFALVAMPLLTWSFFGAELPKLSEVWIAPRVARVLPPGAPFASAGFAEPSLVFLCGTNTTLLANGRDAARFLNNGAGRVILVDERDLPSFEAEAQRLGVQPHLLASVSGYNYSRGKRVRLQLFTNG